MADLTREQLLRSLQQGELLLDVDLSGLDLSGISFDNLQVHDFGGATQMYKVDLSNSVMPGADLSVTDLTEADMTDADLFGANLTEAQLFQAKLVNANLRRANLFAANLESADLSFADLREAYLGQANLRGARLAGAIFDEETVLPDGAHWSKGTDVDRFIRQDEA